MITGTSRGLGLALTAELLGREYFILGLGRVPPVEFSSSDKYLHCAFDLESVEEFLPALGEKLEEVALLQGPVTELLFIHNASIVRPLGLLSQIDPDEMRESMDVNLIGPFRLYQSILGFIVAHELPARLILISSSAAANAIPGMNLYAATKAALEMLVRGIHSEAPYLGATSEKNIVSIGFRPGRMDTPMQTEMRATSPTDFPVVGRYIETHREGKLRDPAEVAKKLVEHLVVGSVESGRIYSFDEL